MKVHICCKELFKYLLIQKNLNKDNISLSKDCFISILNNDCEPIVESNDNNVLCLRFDDITDKDLDKPYLTNEIIFTANDAKQIIDFCEKNRGKENLYVHCFAGISRSGAVGLFVNDFYGDEPYFNFRKRFSYIHPNPYVLRMLKYEFNYRFIYSKEKK